MPQSPATHTSPKGTPGSVVAGDRSSPAAVAVALQQQQQQQGSSPAAHSAAGSPGLPQALSPRQNAAQSPPGGAERAAITPESALRATPVHATPQPPLPQRPGHGLSARADGSPHILPQAVAQPSPARNARFSKSPPRVMDLPAADGRSPRQNLAHGSVHHGSPMVAAASVAGTPNSMRVVPGQQLAGFSQGGHQQQAPQPFWGGGSHASPLDLRTSPMAATPSVLQRPEGYPGAPVASFSAPPAAVYNNSDAAGALYPQLPASQGRGSQARGSRASGSPGAGFHGVGTPLHNSQAGAGSPGRSVYSQGANGSAYGGDGRARTDGRIYDSEDGLSYQGVLPSRRKSGGEKKKRRKGRKPAKYKPVSHPFCCFEYREWE